MVNYLMKAELTLEPYFAQRELKEGFIRPFRENNTINESHKMFSLLVMSLLQM